MKKTTTLPWIALCAFLSIGASIILHHADLRDIHPRNLKSWGHVMMQTVASPMALMLPTLEAASYVIMGAHA